MNSTYTSPFSAPASATDLESQLDHMEKAGVSWEDRAAFAIDFLESRNQKNNAENPQSEPTLEDEELTYNDDADTSEPDPSTSEPDPSTSEQDANTSEPEANTSEPASDPNANQSDPSSEPTSKNNAPEPEPELPEPPKFQFGPSNPLYEVALDFRAYRDKRSILDRLTDTQRHAIIQLLGHYTEYQVAELLAKAPPAGLSIRVSRGSLNRFRNRYQKQERQRNAINFQLQMHRLLETTGVNDQAFLNASERYLKMRLFETTSDPNANLETVGKLTHVITTLRKQSLAERKAKQNPDATEPLEPAPPKTDLKNLNHR